VKIAIILIAIPLFMLFAPLLLDVNKEIFANDGPLGWQHAEHSQNANITLSHWNNLNWLGSHEPDGIVNISWLMFDNFTHPLRTIITIILAYLFWSRLTKHFNMSREWYRLLYLSGLTCLEFSVIAVGIRVYVWHYNI